MDIGRCIFHDDHVIPDLHVGFYSARKQGSVFIHCVAVFIYSDRFAVFFKCTVFLHDDIGLVSFLIIQKFVTIFVHIMSAFNVTVAVNRKLDILGESVSIRSFFLMVAVSRSCRQLFSYLVIFSFFGNPAVDLGGCSVFIDTGNHTEGSRQFFSSKVFLT